MNAVIVAGGRGSRLGALTADRPKPLVEVGGRPVLWHVIQVLRSHGVDRVIVAAGYRSEQVVDACEHDANVEVVNTGANTGNAARLARVLDRLGDERFYMAWSDGLTDADLGAMRDRHADHGRLATVLAIHPPARFGRLGLKGDLVTSFVEKQSIDWFSGGFFVLDARIGRYLSSNSSLSWERDVTPALVRDGQLAAHRHDGFWACMDLPHEVDALNELWQSGRAPWKRWDD
ncbi:MAG: sugar phosphate nucleotidyltransferase [Planctomycetota bacterium]